MMSHYFTSDFLTHRSTLRTRVPAAPSPSFLPHTHKHIFFTVQLAPRGTQGDGARDRTESTRDGGIRSTEQQKKSVLWLAWCLEH